MCLLIAGCNTTYRTVQSDDRFSSGKESITRAEGCRVSSKSIAGGTHLDDSGFFLNPFIGKDKTSGMIMSAGFTITNLYDHSSLYGSPNALGVISVVAFNVDGQVIEIKIEGASGSTSNGGVYYNNVDKSASFSANDSAVGTVSVDNLEKIIRGKKLRYE